MSVKEKDMVKDILDNKPVISKDDEKLLKEIMKLSDEWDKIQKEEMDDDFKVDKEDWEGIPTD